MNSEGPEILPEVNESYRRQRFQLTLEKTMALLLDTRGSVSE